MAHTPTVPEAFDAPHPADLPEASEPTVSPAAKSAAPSTSAAPSIGSIAPTEEEAPTNRTPHAFLLEGPRGPGLFLAIADEGMVFVAAGALARHLLGAQKIFRRRRLVFPARLELKPQEIERCEASRPRLLGAGLDTSPIGPRTLALHTTPSLEDPSLDALLALLDPESLLRGLLPHLSQPAPLTTHVAAAVGDAVANRLPTDTSEAATKAASALRSLGQHLDWNTIVRLGEHHGYSAIASRLRNRR